MVTKIKLMNRSTKKVKTKKVFFWIPAWIWYSHGCRDNRRYVRCDYMPRFHSNVTSHRAAWFCDDDGGGAAVSRAERAQRTARVLKLPQRAALLGREAREREGGRATVTVTCPKCGRGLGARRFAWHLERCLRANAA